MKRGAPRCDKMRDLAKRLQLPLHSAVGIMEMLWHYAGQETPRGNIGIATDLEIAQACHWEKRPAVLIQALVDSRWIDLSEQHRLIIHDWPDHADNSVKKWLGRNGKSFLPEYATKNGQCPEKCLDIVQKNFDPPRAGLAWLSEVSGENQNFESEGVQGEPGGAAVDSPSPILKILDECEQLYAMAGKPLAEKHRNLAVQLLLGIQPDKLPRLPNYIKWALSSGTWSDPAHTKSLLNLIRDGDWDVELTHRTLPTVARNKSRGEAAQDKAAQSFLAKRGVL